LAVVPEMKLFLIYVVGLFCAGVGYGAEVGDFDHVQRNLQSDSTDQPYRTGYHFQPPRNWMNGALIYTLLLELLFCFKANELLILDLTLFLALCYPVQLHILMNNGMTLQIQMVSSSNLLASHWC